VEQTAFSTTGALRGGSSLCSVTRSITNEKHANHEALTKSGTIVAWVRCTLEVTTIFVAITLTNIGLVKIVDTLLDAVHH
jgi:hypothetical protein